MAEKKLYKEVTVLGKEFKEQTPSQKMYRGISTVNESNSSFALYDMGLIKQDLLNHFHIRQGEKLENPEFGTIIWDILYDPLTDEVEQALKRNVEEIIDADPRIRATAIVITPFESGIQIEVELEYIQYNISERLKLTFDQNNGLLN